MPLQKINLNGVTYFELHITCPVCNEQGKNTPRAFWAHAICGSRIFIGDNAFYYCSKCNRASHLRGWRYKCPTHSTADQEYVGVGSAAVMAEIISCAGSMVAEAGQEWLIKCIANIGTW